MEIVAAGRFAPAEDGAAQYLEHLRCRRSLWQLFAHQRAHGLVASYRSVLGLFIPRFGFAAVGGIAEPLIERAGPRVALLDSQLGPAQAARVDPLLGGPDEECADPARLQRPVDGELPQCPGARGQRV